MLGDFVRTAADSIQCRLWRFLGREEEFKRNRPIERYNYL
jgi:hypothetical protein